MDSTLSTKCSELCNKWDICDPKECGGNENADEDDQMQEDEPYRGYNTEEGIPDHFD